MVSVPLGVLMLVGAYAYLMVKKPELLKGTMSTLSIVFNHLQTVLICSQLQLDWPNSVSTALTTIGFDFFSIEVGRPECFIGEVDEEKGGPWYLFSAAQLGILALLFLLIYFGALLDRLRLACQIMRFNRIHRAHERDVVAARKAGEQQRASAGEAHAGIREGVHTRRIDAARRKANFREDKLELVETILFG
jgi:hypothetical protein